MSAGCFPLNCAMYTLFPPDPASFVELGGFRSCKVLISSIFFVGFSRRGIVWEGDFVGRDAGSKRLILERLGKMSLIRSLGTLVLLGCVSLMLGCNADESTAGPGGGAGGSGVAGGAVVPHTHSDDDADDHGHEAVGTKVEEPKVEEPKVEEPKVEEPKVEEPKVEEPKVEEPKVEEPKVEEPKVEEPKVEEPKAE